MSIFEKRYFPHVDGLRALAVVSVILFHLGSHLLPGGFVGVDIFFVISGYLITSHIVSDIRAGRFTFARFYLRRARRLAPAFLFIALLTVLVAPFALGVEQVERLRQSALSAVLYVSNIFFWLEAGYFDADSITKPFLHTWSLAVEEQFYIVWPILLLLVSRWPKGSLVALVVLFGISLGASFVYTAIDPTAAFFLTPFRMFEFAIGGLLSFISRAGSKNLFDAIFTAGLALVAGALFFFDESTPFPGAWALVPCVGAALLIYAGGHGRFTWLLGNHVMVHIGRISYSLYLVHWPVVVLLTAYLLRPLRAIELPFVLLAMYVLAYFSFRWVETPFRERRRSGFIVSDALLLWFVIAGMLFVSAVAWFSPGLSRPWQSESLDRVLGAAEIQRGKQARFTPIQEICAERSWERCRTKGEGLNVLILGDSHAPDALNALVAAYPDAHYVMVSEGGCPPMTTQDFESLIGPKHPSYKSCAELHDEFVRSNWIDDFDFIVISVMFDWYRPEHLGRFLDELKEKTDTKVFVFSNYLVLKRSFPEILVRRGALAPEHVLHFDLYGDDLRALAEAKGVALVDKADILCSGSGWEDCSLFSGGEPFTYDKHHLSLEYAKYLGSELKSRADSFESLHQALMLRE